MRFKIHYTREEARALLPQLSVWLKQLQALREELGRLEIRSAGLMQGGQDAGGDSINASLKAVAEMRRLLLEFTRREVQVKDLERGLLDFPALMGTREVFLCWEQGDEDIEFWHDLDAGYAGREHL